MEEGNESSIGYIKTAAHNYVSRQAVIHNPMNVEMKGKSIIMPKATLRGDFGASIRMGRYCRIGEDTILKPPYALFAVESDIKFVPLTIGNHSWIGKNCVVEAAAVGSSVHIGDNCVLSKRCIVKDCCWIDSGTVVVEDMVIPPFSIVSGVPGRIIGELPESASIELTTKAADAFSAFVSARAV